MKRQIFSNSVLREEWDSVTRLYTTWDETGSQTGQRAFTTDEATSIDAEAAAVQADANEVALKTNLGAGAVFDALRTVAAGTGTFATNATRDAAIRTCARGLVILIRLTLRRLDTTD